MLAALSIRVIARVLEALPRPVPRIPASPALLDALDDAPDDPALWATIAQLVYPLPPHLHDIDVPLSHPALPRIQAIPDSPDFSLLTVVSLPHCPFIYDDAFPRLRALHRLTALDLRGCLISSHALTILARPLPTLDEDRPTTAGASGLRLLSLHGCPNIDDDALSVLLKFPLLSAVDLRFTRCTPAAVHAWLSSSGFRPSDNNSLFHPAPLSVAICTLEKLALDATNPISLYSCPPHSVFRLHINELQRLPSHYPGSTTSIDPPLPTPAPVSATDRPTHISNVSSFYETQNKHSRRSILPLSAQVVRSSEGEKLDPLAIARSPPPWKAPDILESKVGKSREGDQTLSKNLKVDRARMHKCGSDAVADMVNQFTCKRPKIESEFALAKARTHVPVKPRNPFVRSARSVFAENSSSDGSRRRSSRDGLRTCRSLPSETNGKPLKPITTLKPPILSKELLPSSPRRASKPKVELKQTQLTWG